MDSKNSIDSKNPTNSFICADCGCSPEDCEKFMKGEIDECPNCCFEKCCCVPPDFVIPSKPVPEES